MQMGISAKKAGVENLQLKRKAAAAGKLNVVKRSKAV
jgi:hypothetical protein